MGLVSRKITKFAHCEPIYTIKMIILNSILALTNQFAMSVASVADWFKNNAYVSKFSVEDNFNFDTGYKYMLGHTCGFVMCGVLFTLLFIGVLWCVSKITPAKMKGTAMRWAFFIVWICGFLVYDIGMCTGEPISLVYNAPMAAIDAFKIFLLNSDISQVHEAFFMSWRYSLFFTLVHFFAAVISTLFVIKYFGFNIRAKWRMWIERFFKAVDETYVFWGFNDASEKLIESIQSYYSEKRPESSYRIILVRLSKENDDNPETRAGIGRILEFLSIPTSELERLKNIKCLTVGTYSSVPNINVANDESDILREKLSLKSLKRIIEKRTRKKVHMLFLGDNEEENLHAASLLLKDKAIKDFAENGESAIKREAIFYCHARYNSVHRVIEDRFMSGRRRVKIIDSSHISVENLKLNENLLPVNFVRVEKDATVSSSFNSLVIGFSEVGQDSVRFLYEYGAFVKTGSTDTDVKRSDFHMNVVDKCMEDVAGAFVANAPAINVSVPSVTGLDNPDALITLNQMDCQSVAFYHSLETWIKDLNYIVIATDNDELNITLAVRIFKLAARYRVNMEDFCILARVHQDEDGHINAIAEHYNRLWEAQCAVKDYNGKIATQSDVKRGDEIKMPIHLFGLDKKTYTYENIIDDSMEQQAVEFKERYAASTEENYVEPQVREDYAWFKEVQKHITCIENDPENNPTLSAIMGVRRMQGQDYANCFHATTKRVIAKEALKKAGLPKEFAWQSLTRDKETIEYRVKDGSTVAPQVFRILNVLAQTEHLRWNASHEILGYVCQGESRNEIKMLHPCIKDWQDLTAYIQSFDYNFVDLVLNIINPERPIEK